MEAATAIIGGLAKHHVKPVIHQHISHFGQNVLWVTTIAFVITFFIFAFQTTSIKSSERANAYTALFIVGVASIAYYSMASGLGITDHLIHGTTYRQLFFARYIDWVFTTPLLLLDLVLISGLDKGTSLIIVGADVGMIVTGLFGALDYGMVRWGWFLAGCAFMLVVMYGLLYHGKNAAYTKSNEVGNLYVTLAGCLLVLWWVYPIVWFFSEGKGTISSDIEVLAYGVLDILAKIVFSTLIFIKHPLINDASANTSALDEPLLGANDGAV